MRSSRIAVLVVAVALTAAATAAWLFPRAFPIVSLKQSLTRDIALARADSFFRAHSLAPAGARTAVRFQGNDSLRTFVELAGGGHDSLNALVRGKDVAPFVWSVRAFVPSNPREARVHFAPDGRIIGFERKLADADRRPPVSADSGQRLAALALDTWIDDSASRWKLVTASYETKKTSGRVDRAYTFERVDHRIAGAPIRAEVGIAGDTPSRVRSYVEIPESFRRRYAEMRSWNDLLALLASLGILAVAIIGMVALTRFAHAGRVRWREPMIVGSVIGLLTLAAGLNELAGSWFSYDSAMSPRTFQAMQVLLALLLGGSTALLVGFTLAAAEVATRSAFPQHLDWWKLWRYRGTREVAYRVGGGYAVATIAFAYVAIFYLLTRRLLGWWVPSELLDDPNQIASPMPWISGIAVSLNAGVWEESLFRALPLSLLSLWVGQRSGRRWLMAAGVIASALVFGFAHSNYESWPPYSRGVEIFVDACFWAVLFLNFGLLVTVIAHFVYDLVLFGLFAASGSATEYRVTAGIILLALLTPAFAALWRWVKQRGFAPTPDDARFAAWTPRAPGEAAVPLAPRQAGVFTVRARRLAMLAAVVGVIFAAGLPPRPTLGPRFTADRARVVVTADSMLVAHGGNPAGWKRLTGIGTDTLESWPRFLREHKLVGESQRFAATYAPPTWWTVRYVHTRGTAAQRTEEWRVRVWPDGRPLDTRHIVPDSTRRDSVDSSALRRIALASLAREGLDTSTLQETELKETARPARQDVTVSYTDTAVRLPAGATARAWVQLAGDEPLVTRRGVELPESFLRGDRERQTNRMMVAGVCILMLVGFIVTGAVFVKRRRPILLNDGVLERRDTYVLLGLLVVLATLSSLNSLPSKLFKYDTAEPWSSFAGSTALGLIISIPAVVILFALWLGLGALRRRVGIPMLADEPSRSTSRDMLIAGLGLGGVFFAMSKLSALVPGRWVPEAPTTALNDAFPLLAGIMDVPMIVMMSVAIFAIPLLVVAGLSRRWRLRAVMAAVLAALVGGAVWALSPASEMRPWTAALAIARVAALSVAVAVWGSLAAWSWVVAALAVLGLSSLQLAVYGAVWQERVAGALTLLVVAALIVAITRRTARADPVTVQL